MKNQNEDLFEDSLKERVGALYELMRNEKLEELEIKKADFHVHLKRKGKALPQTVQQMMMPVQAAALPATEQSQTEQSAPEAEIAGETVKSPIMGVFYRSPSPSSPPFIKEGDVVETGKTMCIVEAMKVMNEIKAEHRLKVVRLLVENGKPINAGQDLFVVERA